MSITTELLRTTYRRCLSTEATDGVHGNAGGVIIGQSLVNHRQSEVPAETQKSKRP